MWRLPIPQKRLGESKEIVCSDLHLKMATHCHTTCIEDCGQDDGIDFSPPDSPVGWGFYMHAM